MLPLVLCTNPNESKSGSPERDRVLFWPLVGRKGEDRWLCTLMLQRGFRVEYSAASDAYTHCPEGFGEFFNQRRRWVPSTMANIFDLLLDYKRTVAINENISMLYIFYQVRQQQAQSRNGSLF